MCISVHTLQSLPAMGSALQHPELLRHTGMFFCDYGRIFKEQTCSPGRHSPISQPGLHHSCVCKLYQALGRRGWMVLSSAVSMAQLMGMSDCGFV